MNSCPKNITAMASNLHVHEIAPHHASTPMQGFQKQTCARPSAYSEGTVLLNFVRGITVIFQVLACGVHLSVPQSGEQWTSQQCVAAKKFDASCATSMYLIDWPVFAGPCSFSYSSFLCGKRV